jgi:hypothetical protein
MDFISELDANEANTKRINARKLAMEESYYASKGLSHPNKWAEEDYLEKKEEKEKQEQWRNTEEYKKLITQLKSGALLQIFP